MAGLAAPARRSPPRTPTPRGAGLPVIVIMIVAALAVPLVAACTAPTGGVPSGSPAGQAGAASGAASSQPTDPASTAAGSPPGSPGAAGSDQPRPPAARLIGAGFVPAEGMLGSWTYESDGSDSPWLPASMLTEIGAAAGVRLDVELTGGARIGAWSARVAAATDGTGQQTTGLGERDGVDPPLDRATLEPLRAGRWVLSVELFFADGRGDATYYWLVSVN